LTAEKTSQIRWVLTFWLFVLSAVAYLDRVNISFTGVLLAAEFHFSNVQLGLMFSAFLAGYALFQTPGGRLADYLGARKVLALAVIWWGIFSALIVVVPAGFRAALFAFLALRFALGAGEAVMFPASNQFVARWIPTPERGLANGLIFAGVGTGATFASPLVTFIMLRYGWRTPFLVCAALGLFVGLVWYLIGRNTPEEHPYVSEAELSKIKAGLPSKSLTEKPKLVSWSRMLMSREVLAISLSYFTYGYVAWIFFSWFFIYLKEARGINLKASGWYSTAPYFAMAVCSPLGGLVNDAISKSKSSRAGRSGVAIVGMILAAIFLVIGSRTHDTLLAVFVLAGGAGALYLSQSSFWTVTADIGGNSAGSVSGLMNMANQIGGMITASLTPWIAAHFGWTSAFYVAAALSFIGALMWLFVDPTKRLDLKT
jgi:ACS family glucarate transporter-like MFS transporter